MTRKALASLILAAITLVSTMAFGQVERVVVRVDGMA